ncbi:hypothetical protein N8Q67_24825 [Enterobacter hormaechei subsp. hormaechei]|nr:hypothetical protein [Enterobacter hormaechei subsp. hormaechei]
MMVVILTPVDGIIRWLPRGFSCSPSTSISEDEVINQINKIGNNAIINDKNAIDASNATSAMKNVVTVLFSARSDPELMQFMMGYIDQHKLD